MNHKDISGKHKDKSDNWKMTHPPESTDVDKPQHIKHDEFTFSNVKHVEHDKCQF